MTARSVDLRGLSLAEAEAKVREFIDANVEENLADIEIAMIDLNVDADEMAAALSRARVQSVRASEDVIAKMAGLVARGGKSLN